MIKQTAVQLHSMRACDCFDEAIHNSAKRCNYRSFVDDWSFVPETGNAQVRGEIFTPRWIVDTMISESEMLPSAAIYSEDYSKPLMEYIQCRVNEPAVGTANYLSTILYHKMKYAQSLSYDSTIKIKDTNPSLFDERIDLDKYHTYILIAVASVYAYDIDIGNLEITKRRLLSTGKHPVNDEETVVHWTSYLTKWINQNSERNKISYSTAKPCVERSLAESHKSWAKFLRDGRGIIDTAYHEATGDAMPEWLYAQCREILYKNIKLFNAIKETDTLDWAHNFFVPGFHSVAWTWWHFDFPKSPGWQPIVSEKLVPIINN